MQKNNSYTVIYLIELPHIKELGMYKDMETYLKNYLYLYKTNFLAYIEYRYYVFSNSFSLFNVLNY